MKTFPKLELIFGRIKLIDSCFAQLTEETLQVLSRLKGITMESSYSPQSTGKRGLLGDSEIACILSSCKDLQVLRFCLQMRSEVPLTKSMEAISEMRGLTVLSLSRVHLPSILKIIDGQSAFQCLTRLELDRCRLDRHGVRAISAKCPNLK